MKPGRSFICQGGNVAGSSLASARPTRSLYYHLRVRLPKTPLSMPRFMYKDVMAQASSSLAQVVGQVDLDAAFGQGARDLVEATLEEFSGSKDECEAICQALCCICLLCSHVDCHCCDDCLRGLGRRRRSSSWLETPKQQVQGAIPQFFFGAMRFFVEVPLVTAACTLQRF